MAQIFEKSAKSLAASKFISAMVVLVVGIAFTSVFVFVEALPLIVKIAAAAAVIVAGFMFIKIIREALMTLKNGQPWRVEITDTSLIWGSPVPEIMEPFQLALHEINGTRRQVVTKKNSKSSAKNKYFIDLRDGSSIEVSDQLSAIPPRKVFQALQDHGIEFHEATVREGSNVSINSHNSS